MAINQRIKELRKKAGLTQKDLAKKVNVSPQVISNWERNYTDPDHEDVFRLAEALNSTPNELLGKEEKQGNQLPQLNKKDENDIQKNLQKIIDNLEAENAYSQFDGNTIDDMDDEDKELLIASLENAMRLAKRLAKQKFTPKKYRK